MRLNIPEKSFADALALMQQGKNAEAIAAYRETLRHDPAHALAWANLATALVRQGKFAGAVACSARAAQLAPQDPFVLMNHGNDLINLDRVAEGLAFHDEAARLRPGDEAILRNRALALREAGRLEDCLALLRAGLETRPDDTRLLWEEATTLLHLGDFAAGWEAFEIRWQLAGMQERRSKTATPWQGEALAGKTILVYEEQGFGDTILCARYIPLLAERGARVIFECKPALHKLFSALPAQLAETGTVREGFDFHAPLMRLPRLFRTDLANMLPPAPLAAGALPAGVAAALARGDGRKKIGIFWSGSPAFIKNHKRAAALTRFLPLASVPGVQLYSLQKGPGEEQLAAAGAEELVIPLGPALTDFAQTAAVVKQLDLVIMTDSAIAHLAGSLGVPVWNLLNFSPYWLYLTQRADTPWYPSMRLFRQPQPGDWDSVFNAVAKELPRIA